MLNNSFQSIHDVFLYRVEHDKKNLTVNLLYEFARTIDEKISKNFITVVIKKMTTIIIKLQKELKERAHRQDQTTEKLTTLQTLLNAKDMIVSISLDIVDEISILINITHLSHIILYAEIRLLIMKY
jgi:HD superfamily phosphodiesterase